ncbi:Crp/Fnr family transcriptional regulator [Paenibacillus phyllosphaerae]|nr:Crp/Fnr family transcriptional regulator [Paenibacillus phyllosphaerae]
MEEVLFKYMSRWTTLTVEEQQAVIEDLVIKEYPKGTVLLRQGDVPTHCYFILQGCVRQFAVHEDGREVTSQFYTEEQAIAVFNLHRSDQASAYTFTCLEDTVLVVGELAIEEEMYNKHTQLANMTRRMIEANFGQMQEAFAAFMASTPEERFRAILHERPSLIERVPQHQLASYLGITPESLSRIKKRVQHGT